jgi:hypothetical protein
MFVTELSCVAVTKAVFSDQPNADLSFMGNVLSASARNLADNVFRVVMTTLSKIKRNYKEMDSQLSRYKTVTAKSRPSL